MILVRTLVCCFYEVISWPVEIVADTSVYVDKKIKIKINDALILSKVAAEILRMYCE